MFEKISIYNVQRFQNTTIRSLDNERWKNAFEKRKSGPVWYARERKKNAPTNIDTKYSPNERNRSVQVSHVTLCSLVRRQDASKKKKKLKMRKKSADAPKNYQRPSGCKKDAIYFKKWKRKSKNICRCLYEFWYVNLQRCRIHIRFLYTCVQKCIIVRCVFFFHFHGAYAEKNHSTGRITTQIFFPSKRSAATCCLVGLNVGNIIFANYSDKWSGKPVT